ncbi:MAG: response regulator [Candidatus Aenigmarchaeota archaeon]|nr:response regulator [Candidatus Aenigmarchaeota archaeon]
MGSRQVARILVIEDNQEVGETLCEAVRSLGSYAALCHNTDEGFTLLSQERFDLVVINFGLPGENGIEGAARIHETMPHLPIVLITGWLIDFDDEALSKSGIDHVLRKPVGLNGLEEIINRLVA